MSEGGWQPHPDASDPAPRRAPVKPGRIVSLGAVCDLGPGGSGGDQSFAVAEFATLDDGRRVTLHQERGFTIGIRPSGREHLREHVTPDDLIRDVLNVVLPDDDAGGEDHPWSWLAGLAQARGLQVTADDLRGLPYEVILTDNVRRWLSPD
jgi:hypothetical protein